MISEILVVAADGFGPHGEPPQQMQDDLRKVLGFGFWAATGMLILSLFLVAGHIAVAHRRGEGGEHVQGLKWIAAGCLLAGSASLIAKAVVL